MKSNTRIKKMFRSKWFWLITALILFRLAMVFLAVYNVPDTGTIGGSWWFGDGGDGRSYFDTALNLVEGKFKGNPYGFALLLIPFNLILDPIILEHISMPLIFLQSFIFYSLITILIYFLSKRFLQKRYKAFIIALFFNIYPYLFYLFLHFFGTSNKILQDAKIIFFIWFMLLRALSESLSTLLMLGSLLFVLWLIEQRKEKLLAGILLGIVSSFAVITRVQNGLILPLYGFALLLIKKVKTFFWFALGALPLIIFQMIGNKVALGSFFKIGYKLNYGEEKEIAFFGFKYLLRIVDYPLRYCPLFFIPMVLGAVLLILGAVGLIKQNKRTGIILFSYFALNTFFIMPFEPALRNPRYFLAVIPVGFIFIYAGIEELIFRLKRNKIKK